MRVINNNNNNNNNNNTIQYALHVIPTLPIVHNINSKLRTVTMFIYDIIKLCFIRNLKVRLCLMFIPKCPMPTSVLH